MSRGLTIAKFVQQVLFAVYKVRLDTAYSDDLPQAFHADTDKFKEVVMEGNFVLQELQKEQDWHWLRDRWNMGVAEILPDGRIPEFQFNTEQVYKVCTGFNDAVRLHHPGYPASFIEIPFTSPRNGTVNMVSMFDGAGRMNQPDNRLQAFVVGDHITFNRQFTQSEAGMLLETDIIKLLPELHICDSSCVQPCASAYEDLVFTEITDPYYMVIRTARARAEADPSASDRILSLTDECSKLLSAMRENDSSKTVPDTYSTIELGFTRIL